MQVQQLSAPQPTQGVARFAGIGQIGRDAVDSPEKLALASRNGNIFNAKGRKSNAAVKNRDFLRKS